MIEPLPHPVIVYVSIGNSDDKLSQEEWAEFTRRIANEVAMFAKTVHGQWYSLPNSRWQNACWCLEFTDPGIMREAREALTVAREDFRQDSVAWAVAETEFI